MSASTTSPAALQDPDLLALAEKVSYRQRSGWGRERASSGAAEIVLADGRAYSTEIHEALGHPDRPLSDDRLRAKFAACATRAARPQSPRQIEAAAGRILALEAEPDVARLVADL